MFIYHKRLTHIPRLYGLALNEHTAKIAQLFDHLKKMNMFLPVYKVILKGFIFINKLSKPFQQLESTTFYDDK